MVEVLIAHGADISAKNDEGQTPLDLARKGGMAEIIKLLDPASNGIPGTNKVGP